METAIRHIHKDFMKNKEAYLSTVKYWESHVMNVLNNKTDYQTWFSNKGGNGSIIMDGNPIFSLIKKDKSKGLRIVQDEPRSKKPYMHSWTEVFDEEEGGENIPVLVISIELSNKTSMDSLTLIEHWFEKYNKASFGKLLEKINRKYENNYVKSDVEMALEAHDELKKIDDIKSKIIEDNRLRTANLITLYNILSKWDKSYGTYVSRINVDLANNIITCVTLLRGALTQMGNIQIGKNSRIIIVNKVPQTHVVRAYYATPIFTHSYNQLSGELEKLNEQLLDDIDNCMVG